MVGWIALTQPCTSLHRNPPTHVCLLHCRYCGALQKNLLKEEWRQVFLANEEVKKRQDHAGNVMFVGLRYAALVSLTEAALCLDTQLLNVVPGWAWFAA